MIPTRAAARRLRHRRLSGGKLRHPLRQRGKNFALMSALAPMVYVSNWRISEGRLSAVRFQNLTSMSGLKDP